MIGGGGGDASQLANQLLAQGRSRDALAVIEPAAKLRGANLNVLTAYAAALKAVGRIKESLEVYRDATKAAPASGVAEHNLGANLADAGRFADAEAACRRAMAKGLDAPETWVVLGHALQAQNRVPDAEAAYREALKRRPTMADAHRDLAQLLWMTGEDADAATEALRAAVRTNPEEAALAMQLAKALEFGDRDAEAYEVLTAAISRQAYTVIPLETAASARAAALGEPAAAVRHAETALAAAPNSGGAVVAAADAWLLAGEPGKAVRACQRFHDMQPFEQQVLARLCTAWRLLGDPRYRAHYDYEQFVKPALIDTPDGWGSLKAYLADLAEALKSLHVYKTHPFDQSLRHGSQTSADLKSAPAPAIRAFFGAIDGPIRRYMADLGQGAGPGAATDVLRRRNTGRYAIAGIWSVKLRPNGFHVDHVHQMGWLSSACYVELPGAVGAGGHEGWIKFGEPGIPTTPPLPPEHLVKPEPGMLVLFPSYMWHGTVPFSGDQPRLTVAFDTVPN